MTMVTTMADVELFAKYITRGCGPTPEDLVAEKPVLGRSRSACSEEAMRAVQAAGGPLSDVRDLATAILTLCREALV